MNLIDADKVVERLQNLKKQNPFINGIRDNSIEAAVSRQTLDYAIEIVKRGGTSDHLGAEMDGLIVKKNG